MERTETSLRYSAPDTNVDIEKMNGYDGGPIKLTNQLLRYLKQSSTSQSVCHQGEEKKFSYSGTKGFVGKIDANGTSDI